MRFKKLLNQYTIITIVITFIVLFALLLPNLFAKRNLSQESIRGKVIGILTEKEIPKEFSTEVPGMDAEIQYAEVKILNGANKNETILVQNVIDENMAYNIIIDKGDEVLLYLEKDEQGNIIHAYVAEICRQRYLAYMLVLFIILLIIFGGIKGIKSVITLGITGVAIIKVLLPLILRGYNPLFLSITVSIAITIITLTIINGINKKTLSAIIGTVGGVLIAGIVAWWIGSLAKLTGLGNDKAQMLMFLPQNINFDYRGLLLSGIIIGSLGAVMDVGMSIASAMYEIQLANPYISSKKLIKSGMNVGRDIMGTMSNTLILAYTGGSLQLMLLLMAHKAPLFEIINWDTMASEIIRALAGSIGLILAIPITALVSGFIYEFQKSSTLSN